MIDSDHEIGGTSEGEASFCKGGDSTNLSLYKLNTSEQKMLSASMIQSANNLMVFNRMFKTELL